MTRSRLGLALALVFIACSAACSSSAGATVKDFCASIKKFQSQTADESTGDKEIVTMFDEIASNSPSDVKPAVRTIRDSINDVADDPQQSEKLKANKDFVAAEACVRTYTKDKCNIDLDA